MVTINVFGKGNKFGTINVNLAKAFDTLNNNFLLAKLNVHVFSFNAIKAVQSYLLEKF